MPRDVHSPIMSIDAKVLGYHRQDKFLKIFECKHFDTYVYYNKCYCNEFEGLLNRHLLPLLGPDVVAGRVVGGYQVDSVEDLRRGYRRIADMLKTFVGGTLQMVSHNTLIAHTRQKILQRYRNARAQLEARREYVAERHACLKAFVKFEKMKLGDQADGAWKPPRIIQFRTFEYLYVLKKRLLAYSMLVKECDVIWNFQEYRTVFTKNYDQKTGCMLVREHWDKLKNPVALCLDHSHYDGSKTEEALGAEHEFWLDLFGGDRHLKDLLRYQRYNRGYTSGGLKYKVKGKRCSGEFTTSDGNSIDNLIMLETYCHASGFTKFFIFVNGDDSIILIESLELERRLDTTYFRRFNFVTKLDRIAETFEQIDYCQCSPVLIGAGWTWVRKPPRVMSRASICPYQYLSCIDRYLTGVGLCELATNQGVPILQAFAIFLLRQGGFVRPLGSVDKIPARLSGNQIIELLPISDVSRVSFQEAFGYTPQEQIMWEQYLAGNADRTQLIKFLKVYKHFHNA